MRERTGKPGQLAPLSPLLKQAKSTRSCPLAVVIGIKAAAYSGVFNARAGQEGASFLIVLGRLRAVKFD